MNLIDLILLSIALGTDCLVVSFSQGLIFKSNRLKNSLYLAITMGIFQGGMPLFGYVGTHALYKWVLPYSKWIVFSIFFALGVKFILESFQPKEEEVQCIGLKCLIGLGIATSIDALVAGSTIKLTQTSLLLAMIIIGIGSFLMSQSGFWMGHFVKNLSRKFIESAGGTILLALAVKSIL